jgi:hypothetical protein
LPDALLDDVMERLAQEGFLEWRAGQYVRRAIQP